MARDLRLSVVEQSPVRKGGTGADALRESIALAVACEAMGYERFWVAEHHNIAGIASTSPEILIGQIAAATSKMRVGSGGVMLPHYSAFKVAENFRMLETLFPGRIDLGLGRAPGGDQRTMIAMSYPRNPIDVRAYPEQVEDLIGYLGDSLPPDHPFASLRAGPPTEGKPEVWLLGSGVDSARLAARRGLPFSFAHFFGNSSQGPAIVDREGWKLRFIRLPKENLYQLYHLPEDYREERNIVRDAPEVVNRLCTQMLLDCDGNFHNGTAEAHRIWLPGWNYYGPDCDWRMR